MPASPISDQDRERLRAVVASIYGAGYSDGMDQAAGEYDLRDLIPDAALRMKGPLKERLSLVDAAVDRYITMIERKASSLKDQGLSGELLFHEVTAYAQALADDKSQIIAEMEFATGRLNGAGNLMDESGIEYEWNFPHFEFGNDHEECPICEAIREGAPYTQEEAEAEGFPSYPHPGCDHGFTLIPKEPRLREALQFPKL